MRQIYYLLKMLFFLLIVFFGITGCTSIEVSSGLSKEYNFTANDLTNRLTVSGETLRLPEGWTFISNTAGKGNLFNFRSPGGVEGGFEPIHFDYNIHFDRLVDFYKNYGFKSDKKIFSRAFVTKKFGTVVTFEGVANNRILLSLLIEDGKNNVIFLHFSSPNEDPLPLEKAILILNTYVKDESIWASVRKMNRFPLFTSFDNTWYWYGDFKNGYYLARKGENLEEDIIAGLWTLNKEEINKLKTNIEFDVDPFIYKFRVSNIPTEFTVYGNKKDGRTSRLYTVFKQTDKTYCLYLIQKSVEDDNDLLKLLEKPEIQNLLDYHILFSDGL